MWGKVKRWGWLAFCLVLFVPMLALLGAFVSFDKGEPLWVGMTVGGLLGVFFALVFGGNRKWKFWDYIFGPEDPTLKDDDE